MWQPYKPKFILVALYWGRVSQLPPILPQGNFWKPKKREKKKKQPVIWPAKWVYSETAKNCHLGYAIHDEQQASPKNNVSL